MGEEKQAKEKPRKQRPEQNTGAILENMYLLQLGMWVFLLCLREAGTEALGCYLCISKEAELGNVLQRMRTGTW